MHNLFFFFNDTATTEIYTLSLHDALPIYDDDNIYYVFRFLLAPTVRKYTPEGKLLAEWHPQSAYLDQAIEQAKKTYEANKVNGAPGGNPVLTAGAFDIETKRSEEHTSELQSRLHL